MKLATSASAAVGLLGLAGMAATLGALTYRSLTILPSRPELGEYERLESGLTLMVVAAALAILLWRMTAERSADPAPTARTEPATPRDGGAVPHTSSAERQFRELERRSRLERLYSDAIDSSIHAFVTLNFDGTVTAWSPGAERMFGYTAQEMIGNSIVPIVPEDAQRQRPSLFAKLKRGEAVPAYDAVRRTKDGREIDVVITATPVREPGGNFVGAFAIISDRSEHKRAEQLFQYAIEACPNGIVITDRNSSITSVNGEVERLFGYLRETLLDKPLSILVPGIEPADMLDPARPAEVGGKVADPRPRGEFVGRRQDGSEVPVEVAVSAFEAADGQRLLVVIVDISERRKADAVLREFAARHHMLVSAVDSSEDGIITQSADGTITSWNKGAEELFGYTAGEALGQNVDIIVPDDHRVEMHDNITRIARGERIHSYDTIRQTKSGTLIDVSLALSPIRAPDGSMSGASEVARDISDRKRLEHLKDEFVSTVNHELRTPLTSISGSLALLASGAAGKLPERALHLLSIAHRNSQRLVRLVNDILDIEKMQSDRIAFDLKRVDVRTLVEQAIESHRGFSESFGVEVRLASDSQTAEISADSDRLTQVLTNLLSNAVKFSPPRSEVAVAIETYVDTVRITVRDSGPGIPQEFRSRMFERFAQAKTSEASRGGSGLGLYIAKQIVTGLGGVVGFEDAPGGGTIFHVTLPRLEANTGDEFRWTNDERSTTSEGEREVA